MSITLYGIKACDTMKKARTWLDEHGVSYVFHDYKVSAIDSANRDRRPAVEKKEFTADEKAVCSIEAMRSGGTCEACQ